jgi:hypothetical protein
MTTLSDTSTIRTRDQSVRYAGQNPTTTPLTSKYSTRYSVNAA